MSKPECKDIVKVILPAVRASLAANMHDRYGYKQKQIAEKLGVVQVAVSKYLSGRHSQEITRIRDYIAQHKLNDAVVDKIVKENDRHQIDSAIDQLCDKLAVLKIA